jgi:hypothetical protein
MTASRRSIRRFIPLSTLGHEILAFIAGTRKPLKSFMALRVDLPAGKATLSS